MGEGCRRANGLFSPIGIVAPVKLTESWKSLAVALSGVGAFELARARSRAG